MVKTVNFMLHTRCCDFFFKDETKSTKPEPLLRPDVHLSLVPAPSATHRTNSWGSPKAGVLHRPGKAGKGCLHVPHATVDSKNPS